MGPFHCNIVNSCKSLTRIYPLTTISGGTKQNIQLEAHVEGPSINFKAPSMDLKLEVQGAESDDPKVRQNMCLTAPTIACSCIVIRLDNGYSSVLV